MAEKQVKKNKKNVRIFVGEDEAAEKVRNEFHFYKKEFGFISNSEFLEFLIKKTKDVHSSLATTICDPNFAKDDASVIPFEEKTVSSLTVVSKSGDTVFSYDHSTEESTEASYEPPSKVLITDDCGSTYSSPKKHIVMVKNGADMFFNESETDQLNEEGISQQRQRSILHEAQPFLQEALCDDLEFGLNLGKNVSTPLRTKRSQNSTTLEAQCNTGIIPPAIVSADTTITEQEETIINELVDCESAEQHNDEEVYEFEHKIYTSLVDETSIVKEPKCIASAHQLKILLGTKCKVTGCLKNIKVDVSQVGYCLKLKWVCTVGHSDVWYSGRFYATGLGINYVTDAAIILSGAQRTHIVKTFDFIGIGTTSSKTYYGNQRDYVVPTIQQEFDEEIHSALAEIKEKNEKVILGGDCQMDSPGYSATKGTYTFCEASSGKVIGAYFGDKREVDLKSTKLETHLFMKGILNLKTVLKELLNEVVTDDHTTIKSLLKKDENLVDINHGLDVWHKASKISKIMAEIGKPVKGKVVLAWTRSLVNHFWYCVANCGGDEFKLKSVWLRALHHICNDHFYCDHGEIELEEGKEWLDPNSKAFEALREKLFGEKWLKQLHYYKNNRHTGNLENYHNLRLVYCPKRLGYKNESYIARGQLAVIDHNRHLKRPQLRRKDGTLVFAGRFGKRSKQWFMVPVPTKKKYSYIPEMIAKTLWRRHIEPGLKLKPRASTQMLAPNIASKPRPSNEDMMERHTARAKLTFTMKQSTAIEFEEKNQSDGSESENEEI